MDKDQDGYVTKEELKDWIKHVSRRYIYEDADSQWGTHDTDGDGGISWDEWFQSTYKAMAGTSCQNSRYYACAYVWGVTGTYTSQIRMNV